ncbi:hypothetical protein H5V43_16290 [Sphingobium fuliginis]|jgi:hypothetical protein|uniref:Uncharacterized protein n=1 Tax=Sphingobium fuliginis (strain ATCC 27551) TaxID=336203 RepID=A0A7M2GFY6_SPHSA|nr:MULTISPECIES: hypothetical protein [Sphingobium]PNQ03646.1 hypothetical protein A8G00_10465 [Sphingobium sp. SA916]QOT71600.1 hypothetical protein H5V43_16290 [Sphingobium fuliginis]
MSDVKGASNNAVEMMDGAVCHFMGSGMVAITSIDDEGASQAAVMGADVMGAAVNAYRAGSGDGSVGAWSYRFMGGDVIALVNREVAHSSAVVTVGDLEQALAEAA